MTLRGVHVYPNGCRFWSASLRRSAKDVKSALTKVKGVKSADVSNEKGLATVVYDDEQANEQQLREAINKTGFKAEPNQEKK